MADWKQITARIRRARGSKDPAAQLSNLFQKTRDAMVAFELARYFETAGQSADAVVWYNTAAQRFRRADWKTKALDAVTRLGGDPLASSPAEIALQDTSSDRSSTMSVPIVLPEPGAPFLHNAEAFETQSAAAEVDAGLHGHPIPASPDSTPPPAPGRSMHRRRGRRGGRNRRKGSPAAATPRSETESRETLSPARNSSSDSWSHEPSEPVSPPRVVDSRSIPQLPVESIAESSGPGVKGRFGDPGLSSRLSLLEMQFRRLLTCAPAKLDDAGHAPAGPGVFVLTDEELSTYYYVEACDTLRIAIANVARGGVGRRGAPSIKPLLADHLGIPESRVSKYLSDHCVVRWLQLDDGATHFAHFAIAVLRPVLNE